MGPDDGCPWCGQSAADMMAGAGVQSFDTALEAHVEDCEPYLAETGS